MSVGEKKTSRHYEHWSLGDEIPTDTYGHLQTIKGPWGTCGQLQTHKDTYKYVSVDSN